MTARGDSLGCSRNPGSNYYAGLTHQLMIDLDADDAAKVSVFHSLWVGKAGGELLQGSPPLDGASVLSASSRRAPRQRPAPTPKRWSPPSSRIGRIPSRARGLPNTCEPSLPVGTG